VVFESATADSLFQHERQKLKSSSLPPQELRPLSDAEVQRLVFEWFVGLESHSVEWWQQSGKLLDEAQAALVIDTLPPPPTCFAFFRAELHWRFENQTRKSGNDAISIALATYKGPKSRLPFSLKIRHLRPCVWNPLPSTFPL